MRTWGDDKSILKGRILHYPLSNIEGSCAMNQDKLKKNSAGIELDCFFKLAG
jgi:hypothetical protein